MRHRRHALLQLAMLLAAMPAVSATGADVEDIVLPSPRLKGEYSVEEALASRRSVRDFARAHLTLAEVGQLLWAAQGITSPRGLRTAPSAGALYPLEIHLVAGAVQGLAPGVYRYRPGAHALEPRRRGDRRDALARAAGGQSWVGDGAAVIAFCAVPARTAAKYGRRAQRYVHIEVGHAAQNVFLQAQALGLAAVVVGAFSDTAVGRLLELPPGEHAFYLVALGRPSESHRKR